MNGIQPPLSPPAAQPAASGRRPVTAWMRAAFAFICVMLIAATAWIVWSSRDVRLSEARVTTENMARTLAAQATMEFKIADVILQDIVERVQHEGAAGGSASGDGGSGEAGERLRAHLEHLARTTVEIQGLFIFDRQGAWRATSLGAPQDGDNSDRDYFAFHKTHPQQAIHIGTPVLSKSSGQWIIPVSRRIDDADGSFGGVALATLRLESFERVYESLNLGEAGTVFFALNTGTLIYRKPFDADVIGMDISSGAILSAYRKTGPTGTAMMTAKVDGIERLYSYRHLERFPVIVAAGLTREDIFAEWQWFSTQIVFCALVALGTLSGLFFRLIQQMAVRDRAETALRLATMELEKANAGLKTMALRDGLTDLANRRAFNETLEEELHRARRDRKPVSLIMLDVDFFKKFNDNYGHVAGDECLRAVARAVGGSVGRGEDLAARYGGEEFAVIMPGTDTVGALRVAEAVRAAVMALGIPHAAGAIDVVTVSVGVATVYPGTEREADSSALIRKADALLYQAKSTGRNRVSG